MPYKKGRGTYKGYESPSTSGWPQEIRDEIRRVYGAWRTKNPGENPAIKARGSRIAWFTAKRKYPKLYSRHIQQNRHLISETKKELKEHPWAGKETARRIASDHIRESKRHKITDLRATAREQRRWAQTAKNEAISENKRSKIMKKAGKPIQARDLMQDSKLAGKFAVYRKRKADNYDIEAARTAAMTGG